MWLTECRLGQEALCERVVVGGLASRAEALPKMALLLALEMMDGGHKAGFPTGHKKVHEK